MIDALRKILDAAVVVHDLQRRKRHVARDANGWFSLEDRTQGGSSVSHVDARINQRWMLSIWSRRQLHHDADTLVKWAASKLAPHFPGKIVSEPAVLGFSGSGGGGSQGSAEVDARPLLSSGRKTPTN
jgi:hypothetical protein